MKFSIIIPTYKRPASLKSCLECVALEKQTYKEPYEIIVSDDAGSDPETRKIVSELPNARAVVGPGKGPAANRNNGARHATGEWLVFTDDDCLPSPDWLQAFADAAAANPSCAVLEGRTVADRPRRSLAETAPINESGGLLWSCNFAIRRDAFTAINGFDEIFTYAAMEDVDLRIRLRAAQLPHIFVPSAVVVHPWRDNGGIGTVWKHEASAKQLLARHPKSRVGISLLNTLRANIAGFFSVTLPGLIAFRGRGFLREMVLHVLRVVSAFRLELWYWRHHRHSMQNGVLYVNSTVRSENAMSAGEISPFHWWGYRPHEDDCMLSHGPGAMGFLLRRQLGGVDPQLAAQTVAAVLDGYTRIYLVTQPDLLGLIPGLKKWKPNLKVITWVWHEAELKRHFAEFSRCNWLLCLTEGAYEACQRAGFGGRSSLELLGADPKYFERPDTPARFDVAVIGRTCRDVDLLRKMAVDREFSICTTAVAQKSRIEGVVAVKAMSHREVVDLLAQVLVSWVLIRKDDKWPTGYTNTVEALLTGTAVVVSDAASFPSEVLRLPGVYKYKAGNAESLTEATRAALRDARQNGFRSYVREQAQRCLNGVALQQTVMRVLNET
ncbi:MAG TPA: glycosyltransferase family A protein [Planctomycetota bacterium]|nr:glycosyltransferase family A protein [Planctomycetota bacterium]